MHNALRKRLFDTVGAHAMTKDTRPVGTVPATKPVVTYDEPVEVTFKDEREARFHTWGATR